MRVFNFSPGPAVLPLEVLEQARAELTDWQGSGMSVMEVSHRGKAFIEVAERAESDLRELLSIPKNYKVLFIQGGASAQFSLIPMNLTAATDTVDVINTGHWSKRAIEEGSRYCKVHVAADAGGAYTRVPAPSEIRLSANPRYLHYTPNETIGGVEFGYVPEAGGVDLVADMSSSILSRPIDVSKFGLIYAGAQKNIGPSGLVVLIVREDLLGRARAETPKVFDYRAVAEENSLLNTPPTFAWYVAGLVFKWLKGQGGVASMGERNQTKARTLYQAIDGSSLYRNAVEADARSRMNVTFMLKEPGLDERFLGEAARAGLTGLKGHRVIGGMRASLYNAMPLEGVLKLIEFMREFERAHG
ncbi:MAG TPA: 3-phosphoserine/phosphohydroxythreonine transaminase [Steroidobacteraceae bacterium]|jgi:phosphoserine aminotransferase